MRRLALSTAFAFGSVPTKIAFGKRLARVTAIEALPTPKSRIRLFASGCESSQKRFLPGAVTHRRDEKEIVSELHNTKSNPTEKAQRPVLYVHVHLRETVLRSVREAIGARDSWRLAFS